MIKVQDRLSEEFGVGMRLRQGCVLSPLLISFYINGVVTGLHDRKCRKGSWMKSIGRCVGTVNLGGRT